MRRTWKTHPVADMFPLIPEGTQAWNELVESIDLHGQIDPIVADGDVLLDGRNRLKACQQLGIAPKVVQWSTLGVKIDQDDWIATKNLERRHLTDDQKAAIFTALGRWQMQQIAKKNQEATQLAGKSEDGKAKRKTSVRVNSPAPNPDRHATRNAIAEKAGVSKHRAAQAIKVNKAVERGELDPEVEEQVKRGEMPLREAVKLVPAKPKVYVPGMDTMGKISEEAKRADQESDTLFHLKRWWRKATKKDRKEFLRWADQVGRPI